MASARRSAPAKAPGTDTPAPTAMDAERALGLWMTNFGAVKIERDDKNPGQIMGVWVWKHKPTNRDVIGFFRGPLRGNVLEFTWQEPSPGATLTGAGYLQFDPRGKSFSGQWWTDKRDRSGAWTGSRGSTHTASSSDLPAATNGNQPDPGQPPEGAPPPPDTLERQPDTSHSGEGHDGNSGGSGPGRPGPNPQPQPEQPAKGDW